MKLFTALLLLLTSFISRAQNYTDTLDLQIGQIYERSDLPGFAVAIVKQGEIKYLQAFGYSDLSTQSPYTINSIQNIGSVSKTFIGLCVMKAEEEGLLSLDAPINDYLPFEVWNPNFPGQPITIRQLAMHTSGILDSDNYSKSYVLKSDIPEKKRAYNRQHRKEITQASRNDWMPYETYLLEYLSPKGALYKKRNFAKTAPGANYEYTNVGATLLAYVIESASGMPFEEYSQKHILDPLNMHASGWFFEDVNMDKHARLYFPGGALLPRYTLNTWPDGGMISSAADLAIYLTEMLEGYKGHGTLISAESYSEMFRIKAVGDHSIGIIWNETKSGAMQHTGGDPGIFSIVQFQPEKDIGLLFLSNCSAFEAEETMSYFVEIWKTMLKYAALMAD
ncbi:MAG: beta-lactamase family protein [Saprospiraceae bacterium]|nr:beta-lactamase family protein [Saprospiraceae bacterium]